MKRLIFFLTITFSISALAQEGPKISSAIIALDRNNDLKSAKEHISAAEEIINQKGPGQVKAKDLSKFYFYNGKINLRIATSEKPEVQAMEENPLEKTAESFQKLLEHEEQTGKERYSDDARGLLPSVAQLYAQRGVNAAGNENFDDAYNAFLTSYELKRKNDMGVDTAMLYNAALMAQNAKNYEQATRLLEHLINMEYRGVQYKVTEVETGKTVELTSKREQQMAVKTGRYTDPVIEGDIRADILVNTANLHRTMGDTATYDSLVVAGRSKFPSNRALLIAELQQYLDNQEYDKALDNLDEAIANDPENALMHYNKGVILQNEMERYDEALEAYQRTLEIDSNYADALYMSSIIYIDRANKIGNEMNELPFSAKKKYDELEKKQTQVFEKALPYLEKAYEINPDDPQIRTTLGQVYRALKMYEKAMKLQEEQG